MRELRVLGPPDGPELRLRLSERQIGNGTLFARVGVTDERITPIDRLGQLVSIGTLLAFVIVSLGVVFLRKQRPELHRPFRTPGVPFIPILSALVSFALMAGLPWHTWERLIIWMALGIVFYFVYGYRHSRLRSGLASREMTADS